MTIVSIFRNGKMVTTTVNCQKINKSINKIKFLKRLVKTCKTTKYRKNMNYINSQDQNYVILKEENPIDFECDYDYNQGTEEISIVNDLNLPHKKCGEIFMKQNLIFNFLCKLCDECAFDKIEEFIDHVKKCKTEEKFDNFKCDPLESNNSDDDDNNANDEHYKFLHIGSTTSKDGMMNEIEELEVKEEIENIEIIEHDSDTITNERKLMKHLNKQFKCNTNNNANNLGKLFSCDKCDKKYALKKSLQRHTKSTHEKEMKTVIFECDVTNCNRKFTTKMLYEKHRDLDHIPVDPFMNIDINDKNRFSNNIDDDEDDDDTLKYEKSFEKIANANQSTDPFVCRYCNKRLGSRMKRVEHERIHTGERPFKCKLCDKCFRTKTNLGKHKLVHEGIKPHKCHMCGISFTEKSNLVQHIRRHIGDKKLPCKFCGKLFQQNSERKIHERIHTGEKPYQCSTCGQCFTTSEKALQHYRRHSNIRPHKCNECGKSFFSKRELAEHGVVHTGERPFMCEICNATFPRKKSLISHQKIHSDVAKYICKICGKGFKQGPGLYCHMKSHGESSSVKNN